MDLHFATISDLGAWYRDGDVSPVEVVDALLNRIDEYGATKAFITVTAERARAEAQAAETLLRAGADLGPLHGIPIALKDLFYTAGIRTTSGVKAWDNSVPDTSATVATRLSPAGAVLIGKTNMVELAFGPYGLNPHYGTPPNPWMEDRVPAGRAADPAWPWRWVWHLWQWARIPGDRSAFRRRFAALWVSSPHWNG